MEDYGTLRAGAATERTRAFAIRGISDLLDEKGEVESKGSQPRAAANAAGFAFELIAESQMTSSAPESQAELVAVFAGLYPEGPEQRSIWERAGGDPAVLEAHGAGRERWWRAIGLIRNGGGPLMPRLVTEMSSDFPHNKSLKAALRAKIK
jgi:hypothetical protein